MLRIERTDEEREHFRMELLNILTKLTEVHDHPSQGDSEEETKAANAKAIAELTNALRNCDVLVSVCGELARKALERKGVNIGSRDEPEYQPVTPEDIEIIRKSVVAIKEEVEARTKAAGKELQQTPEVVATWQAISRVNKVSFFYPVFYGGAYGYWEQGRDRNKISVQVHRKWWFGGIPPEKLPKREIRVRKDNLTTTLLVPDFSTFPENSKRIYEILKVLEKEQPTVELPVEPGNKTVLNRIVNRAGEAKFFLDHLPPGLKKGWAETTATS